MGMLSKLIFAMKYSIDNSEIEKSTVRPGREVNATLN